MRTDSKKLFRFLSHNKKFSLLFRGITVLLFLVLAVAFFISITYSMVMEENFYKNRKSGSEEAEYSKSFLVLMVQSSNDFLTRFRQAILSDAQNRNVRIDFVNVESISEAVNAINTAVAAKVDGIIAQGIYDTDYIEAINQAIAKGIMIQFVYTDARGTDRDYFVGYNAYDFGKRAARCVIEELPNGPSSVALMVQSITDVEKDVTSSLFVEGFKSVIDKHPMVTIVDIVRTSYDLFSAEDTTYDILNRYPNLNAIVCTSEKDTFGAAQVIIDLNRVAKTSIIGVGVSEDILKYIELEVIAASFDMKPEIMSSESLDIMLEEKAASEYVEVPITTVSFNNVRFFRRDKN
ncbi:MAG: substrate-binding domain-containing protein [Thermoclostridium sp.]|nr:substrate-binding domain-containing protein [Thermoclostridium sp.]